MLESYTGRQAWEVTAHMDVIVSFIAHTATLSTTCRRRSLSHFLILCVRDKDGRAASALNIKSQFLVMKSINYVSLGNENNGALIFPLAILCSCVFINM